MLQPRRRICLTLSVDGGLSPLIVIDIEIAVDQIRIAPGQILATAGLERGITE